MYREVSMQDRYPSLHVRMSICMDGEISHVVRFAWIESRFHTRTVLGVR